MLIPPLIVSIILQAQMSNTPWSFQLFNCEDLLYIFKLCDNKLNIFGFSSLGWKNKQFENWDFTQQVINGWRKTEITASI